MHLLNSFFICLFLSFFFFFFFFLGGGGEVGLGTKDSSEGTDKTSQHIHIINEMLEFKI